MKPVRKYLRPDGTERLPTEQENSHYGMARTELGADWKGDAEDAYAAMWNLGWVRVVEHAEEVHAECYRNGPVPVRDLSAAQQLWLRNKEVYEHKAVRWNGVAFAATREG